MVQAWKSKSGRAAKTGEKKNTQADAGNQEQNGNDA